MHHSHLTTETVGIMVSVISQIETEHHDAIHDAQMDYYGTRLATCSSDKTIRIFNTSSGSNTLEATLEGHEQPVWQVSWAHPSFGNILASCSYDKKVFIWKETKPKHWEKIHEYTRHESSVNSISWAPKEFGLILATASSDGSIAIISRVDADAGNSEEGSGNSWDDKKIMNAHSVGCNAVSWKPAVVPSTIALKTGEATAIKEDAKIKRLASCGADFLVKIWKFVEQDDKWVEEARLEGHSDWVRDVSWSPSIGTTKLYLASCSQDRRVLLWTRELGSKGGKASWTHQVLHTFDDIVWHVSWSLMGNILAVSTGDNKISLWKETLSGNFICISQQVQQ